MKFRISFVSNSSSCSFIIVKTHLSKFQKESILNIQDEYFKQNPWKIKESEFLIEGFTSMDNFNMVEYLKNIGVDIDRYVRFF